MEQRGSSLSLECNTDSISLGTASIKELPSEYNELCDVVTCSVCLEYFDNPRSLSCSHTFCQHCLVAISQSEDSRLSNGLSQTRCPQCRQYTVPGTAEIPNLPANQFAQQIVELINRTVQIHETKAECDDYENLPVPHKGDMMPLIPTKSKRSTGSKVASIAAKGLLALTTVGLGNLYIHRRADSRKKKREAELKTQNPYLTGYTCGACHQFIKYTKQSELRYKCGMCEDFSICPSCACQLGAHVHRSDHIFIKLNFKQTRRLPPGPVLKQSMARVMSESIDYDNMVHGPVYIHTQEKLLRLTGIHCFQCKALILGTRFKCGMCLDFDLCSNCEERSTTEHEKDHVFLVITNRMAINFTIQPIIKAFLY